ncbi:hypothetical protein EV182_003861, partial [Spiromyces aspiralis]
MPPRFIPLKKPTSNVAQPSSSSSSTITTTAPDSLTTKPHPVPVSVTAADVVDRTGDDHHHHPIGSFDEQAWEIIALFDNHRLSDSTTA